MHLQARSWIPRREERLMQRSSKTLQAVLQNGGQTSKARKKSMQTRFLQVDRAADLWSLLPSSVSAESAVRVDRCVALERAWEQNTSGIFPRSEKQSSPGAASLAIRRGTNARKAVGSQAQQSAELLLLGARMGCQKGRERLGKSCERIRYFLCNPRRLRFPNRRKVVSCSECQTGVSQCLP